VGTWKGEYLRQHDTWLRFFDEQGQPVLVEEEALRGRAEAAEAEVTRLRKLLGLQDGGEPPAPGA
jgi:hypothetical protein